ncbi:hypothetical protein [Paenibacillus amylolyticus]|uniref:Uncharacterized protein n=1 Tax=Paenibacillus amylolyticus TaxID=1451 RepID=A0A100VTR9_PAEAM|nr:hypothetical protein [Paenibacillus amylolyticus]GAS85664.1 unknown protein [Paenibacillus amylolyticus]
MSTPDKVFILHVWEEKAESHEITPAWLVNSNTAVYLSHCTVFLVRVIPIRLGHLTRYYVEDAATCGIHLAQNVDGDPELIVARIIEKLRSRTALDWLADDVLGGMTGLFEFQV